MWCNIVQCGKVEQSVPTNFEVRKSKAYPTGLLSVLDLLSKAEDDEQLGDDDSHPRKREDEADQEDLDVELDEADPRGAGEGGPRVLDGDVAPAADDGRLQLALEGAVEGDDGLVLLGEQGRLDARQDHVRGDHEEHLEGHRQHEHDQGLPDVGGGALGHGTRLGGAPLGEAEGAAHEPRQERRELEREEVQDDGEAGGAEGLAEGRQAAPERLRARRRDHDVQPGRVELDEGDGADGARHQRRHERAHQDPVDEHRPREHGHPGREPPEVREPPADAVQGAVGRAERGRDRAGLGAGGFGGESGSGGVVAREGLRVVVEGDGLVGRWGRVLDHGQHWVDVVEGVADL